MIHDVGESLRGYLRAAALLSPEIDIVFDAPTKDWSSRRNAPTIDVYLYDIREDMRRREHGQTLKRDADRTGLGIEVPPRWFKLSYLVTAWTQRPEDEHRLLSAVLQALLLRDALPAESLVGSLRDLGVSISFTCGLPPPQDRALSDVWSALGGELKPSLDVVVTAPFDLSRLIDVGPPVLAPAIIGVRELDPDGAQETTMGRGPVAPGPGAATGAKASTTITRKTTGERRRKS